MSLAPNHDGRPGCNASGSLTAARDRSYHLAFSQIRNRGDKPYRGLEMTAGSATEDLRRPRVGASRARDVPVPEHRRRSQQRPAIPRVGNCPRHEHFSLHRDLRLGDIDDRYRSAGVLGSGDPLQHMVCHEVKGGTCLKGQRSSLFRDGKDLADTGTGSNGFGDNIRTLDEGLRFGAAVPGAMETDGREHGGVLR